MTSFWRRVGGTEAISWVMWCFAVPTILAINVFASGVNLSQHGMSLVIASLGSVIAMMGWLFAAKFTLLRGARVHPMPVSTLAVFLVAAFVRALVFDQLLLFFGATQTPELGYRFFSSLPAFLISFVVVAYIVSLAKDFSRNIAEYQVTAKGLSQLRDSAHARISAKREELSSRVRKLLDSQIRELLTDTPDQALERMRRTIDDVVRPLSHELNAQMPDFTLASASPPARIEWKSVIRNAMDENPIRPLLFASWIACSAVIFITLRHQLGAGLLYTIAAFLVAYLGLHLGRWLWNRFFAKSGFLMRSICFTLWLAALAALLNAVAQWVFGETFTHGYLVWPQMVLSVVTGWFIALVFSLEREYARSTNELSAAQARVKDELLRLTTAFRLQQRAISRALHGPIQDVLSAATFRLATAIEEGSAEEELLTELQRSIADTLYLIDVGELESVDVEQMLTEIGALWSGLTQVEWSMDAVTAHTLKKHSASAVSVAEILREACANAIRHGKARRVEVRVRKVEHLIEVEVRNNGHPVTADAPLGMGTSLLDDLTTRWSRDVENDTTVLRATVPLV